MTFTIEAELEISFPGTDPTETETARPTVEITYSYTAGSPARGPSYSSGGEPATGPEIEAMSVKVLDSDGIDLPHNVWIDRAQDWLDDEGYERACDHAECNMGPDPDYEYDRRRDED